MVPGMPEKWTRLPESGGGGEVLGNGLGSAFRELETEISETLPISFETLTSLLGSAVQNWELSIQSRFLIFLNLTKQYTTGKAEARARRRRSSQLARWWIRKRIIGKRGLRRRT
jgi:hypothetical protein